MATKIVRIKLRGTHAAVRRLDRQVQAGVRGSLREAAQFGQTAVERQIARTRPRPVASNTYRLAWHVKNTKDGAILGNSAAHSIQVEVGREPGRPPPIAPLREWVLQKRLVKPYRPRAPKPRKSGDVTVYNSKREEKKRKRRYQRMLRAQRSRHAQATAIAARIAKAIARKGIKGRYPLAKSLPRTQRFLRRELVRQTKSALAKHTG